jgi:hypothetical protein
MFRGAENGGECGAIGKAGTTLRDAVNEVDRRRVVSLVFVDYSAHSTPEHVQSATISGCRIEVARAKEYLEAEEDEWR